MSAQRFAVAWWNGKRWAWASYALGDAVTAPTYERAGTVTNPMRPTVAPGLVRVYVCAAAGCDPEAVSILPEPPAGTGA